MDKARVEILRTILWACKIILLTRLIFQKLLAGSTAISVTELPSSPKIKEWSQKESTKEIITIGDIKLFLNDISTLCNKSPLSEKVQLYSPKYTYITNLLLFVYPKQHAMCFFQLLAYEQSNKEPYNEVSTD